MKEQEPVIPNLVKKLKSRRLRKKQREIEELKLEIEKAKLKRQLKEVEG